MLLPFLHLVILCLSVLVILVAWEWVHDKEGRKEGRKDWPWNLGYCVAKIDSVFFFVVLWSDILMHNCMCVSAPYKPSKYAPYHVQVLEFILYLLYTRIYFQKFKNRKKYFDANNSLSCHNPLQIWLLKLLTKKK